MGELSFLLQPGEQVSYGYTKRLWAVETKLQKIAVLQTKTFGRSIFIDQKPQSSELDHFVFNEILVHPALLMHPKPRKVFIAGGGPGSCLREVMRHRSVESVTKCDIDERAVGFYRRHLKPWHEGAFDDPRLRLKFCDARKYLEENDEKYDCIIVDVPDPVRGSPSTFLFTKEFYALAKSRLTKNGVFVTQAGRTNLNNLQYHLVMQNTIETVFRNVASYERHIPFYAESWGFILAGNEKNIKLAAPTARQISARIRGRLRFYNPEIHSALFAKPSYWKELRARVTRTSSDRKPLIVV